MLTSADQALSPNWRSGRLTCSVERSPVRTICLKAGKTTDPPACFKAARNAASDAGSDGELKSTSNTMSRTPAASSRPINSAWRLRGQGQTPTFSIEGESIATTTMSPVASRDVQRKR